MLLKVIEVSVACLILGTTSAKAFCPAMSNYECMDFIYVPGGNVYMGSPEHEWGRDSSTWGLTDYEPTYELVRVQPFWISLTEVTVGLWKTFLDSGAYDEPHYWSCEGNIFRIATSAEQQSRVQEISKLDPRVPITRINAHEIEAFCKWYSETFAWGIRLPTEIEWEYVAEGHTEFGESKLFPWGDIGRPGGDSEDWQRANTGFDYDPWEGKSPVLWNCGDISWCGALNMVGNVSELVLPVYSDQSSMVMKGGNYVFGKATDLSGVLFRVSNRAMLTKESRTDYLGFRIVHQCSE